MLNAITDRRLNQVRWLFVAGWLMLIICLFNDAVSHWLTSAENHFSPWRIVNDHCVPVQHQCLANHPYHLAIPIFWGYVVPGVILILLVCGHEVWRRICPLAFISQLPSRFGWQRQQQVGKSSKRAPVKVAQQSWLGRNYLYLQFALLYVGICARLLLINAEAIALGLWLMGTMLAAVIVGYLYAGKSWCQYFCPMAPVQRVFSQPTGILTSKAHAELYIPVTQSTCRTIDVSGNDKKACVGCQRLCMDIDAEKNYWASIEQPAYRLIYYGYIGLIIGFFSYHYVYAGNWEYFFSGIWARQTNQINELMSPGFYLSGRTIVLPKLLVVPAYIGIWIGCTYWFGYLLEQMYSRFAQRLQRAWSKIHLLHHLYSLTTFAAFNIFFFFVGKSWGVGLPVWGQSGLTAALIILSILWLYRMTRRSPERYSREQLAKQFRVQLAKRDLYLPKSWWQRQTEDLNVREVATLIQAIPGYGPEQSQLIYQQLLDEILAEMDGTITARIKLAQLRVLRNAMLAMMSAQIQFRPIQDDTAPQRLISDGQKYRGQRDDSKLLGIDTSGWHQAAICPPEVWIEL
ncbi:4Fe-4S binding protein [filamentous cyanobacterium LEGE 11480]|uniref:4Fe-4S binding protein n=1 Tax=Romeriopsis navalis LEGE 11480 TaxID=2777977 RepID=A0A928VPY7_9CYAN|nr:4Fe-4S binding protein [Romeriopsis navalis]MBE9030460.1 4Fe-4S binding protein [Romeriopsis navalis LEGE 11480]